MRVVGRDGRDERGAVLIIFALYVLVAVIFLAFVVDVGNQRQDRRQLTTATDAAALAVAQQWADNSLDPLTVAWGSTSPFDCSAEADVYLVANRAENPESYTCQAELVNGQLGSVVVYAGDTTQYQVGPVFGQTGGGIGSLTAVKVSSTEGGGLRPFALCARDEDVEDWYNDPNRDTQIITVGGDKFLPPECQQQNSNWGFVQFETQGTGIPNLVDVIENGTEDPVSSFNDNDGNFVNEQQVCINDDLDHRHYDDQSPVTCVFTYEGAGAWNNSQTEAAFDTLIDNGTTFSLPLYGEIADLGGGTAGFPIIAFAEVRMLSYNSAGANDNSVTLEFLSLSAGDCCDVNDSNQLLQICDVGSIGGAEGASFATDCQTSDASVSDPPILPPLPDPCVVTSVTPVAGIYPVSNVSGGNYQLDTDAVYTVTVVDAADCDAPTAVAKGSGKAEIPATSVVAGGVANTYVATWAAGTDGFAKDKLYLVEISDAGALVDSSATLLTVS